MNILFDSWGTQVLFQKTPPSYPQGDKVIRPTVTGMRLNTLLGAMQSIGLSSNKGWNISYTTPPITSEQLEGVDVYVSLTREQGTGYAYTPDELTAISNWVAQGGNILLATNHGGFPNNRNDNYMANDAALANLFNVTLQDYSVQNWNLPPLPPDKLIVQDTIPYIANNASVITAHNSCIIVPPEAFTSIIEFPGNWTAYNPVTDQKNLPPPTPYFSVLVPGTTPDAGQMIVIGNSGWIGDYGSPRPACGLISMDDNLMFILNCIGYLGGLRQIPAAGQCPA